MQTVQTGFVEPRIVVKTLNIGHPDLNKGRNFITCVQIYSSAIDDAVIPALELCPNRHSKFFFLLFVLYCSNS